MAEQAGEFTARGLQLRGDSLEYSAWLCITARSHPWYGAQQLGV